AERRAVDRHRRRKGGRGVDDEDIAGGEELAEAGERRVDGRRRRNDEEPGLVPAPPRGLDRTGRRREPDESRGGDHRTAAAGAGATGPGFSATAGGATGSARAW